MALCLCLVSLPLFALALDEDVTDSVPEYVEWSQSDSRWGNKKISKKTMASVGCLVTALAKLMVHSGQRDPAIFDPGVCLDELKSCGIFKGSDAMYMGLLDTDYFPTYAPELTKVVNSGKFSSAWSEDEAAEEISEFIENGYYVIVMSNTTRGTTHWMCVDNVRNGKLYVMDNNGISDLYARSEYKGVSRYMLVKYSGNKEYPAYSGSTKPSEPSGDMPKPAEVYSAPSELRVRKEPSLSSTTLRYLDLGEQITIDKVTVADEYTWGHLTSGGWCAISICTYVSGSIYFISYDVGSATFDILWQEKPFGASTAITDLVPTLDGYTFVGWSTGKSAVEAEYLPGDTITVSGDVTLYPVWKSGNSEPTLTPLPERVERYVTPSGLRVRSLPTISSESDVLSYRSTGDIVSIDKVTVCDNYTWGHLTDDSGWVAISLCSYLDGSLYFAFYEGGLTPHFQQNPSSCGITVRSDIPKLAGKNFLGWSTAENSSSVEYTAGDSIKINSDLTLYPVWQDGCDHAFDEENIAPSDDDCGYLLRTCSLCGKIEKNDLVDSLGKLSVNDGKIIYRLMLAKTSVSVDLLSSVIINGNAVPSELTKIDLAEDDGATEIVVTVLGTDVSIGGNITISLTVGSTEYTKTIVSDKPLFGYDSAGVSAHKDLCTITLTSDALSAVLHLGDTLTATDENGNKYSFETLLASGNEYVLTCQNFDSGDILSFGECGFAVFADDAEENVKKLSCPSDRYFVPYYQVRQIDDDAATKDLRFVFVGNYEKLRQIDAADVEITFTKNSTVVRKVSGVLGGEGSDYKLFTALTAVGDIYVADDGYAVFGQEILNVPLDAFDSFTIRITDKLTGAVLLSCSLG